MTDAITAVPAKPKSALPEFVDSLSKATVAALFAIYVFGFLVVSIHDASYGFSEVNPLKPKIISAGTLFLVLVLVPIVSARRIFSHKEQLTVGQRFSRATIAALMYFTGCIVLSFFLTTLYVAPPANPPVPLHGLSLWVGILKGVAIVVSYGWVIQIGWDSYLTKPKKTVLVAGLYLIGVLIFYIQDATTKVGPRVGLWFFVIGLVATLANIRTNNPEKRTIYDWNDLVITTVAALAIFPTAIYPNIKSSWGGGSPTQVVVYFSLDSRILPGQQMKAELLDESDAGIYVVRYGDKQALFIPRGSVSGLFFSSEALPEEFLKASPKQP